MIKCLFVEMEEIKRRRRSVSLFKAHTLVAKGAYLEFYLCSINFPFSIKIFIQIESSNANNLL